MIHKVLTYPNPFLMTACEKVVELSSADLQMIEDMKETCRYANGYALAANQIGWLKRVVVFSPNDVTNDWLVMINPTWTANGDVGFIEDFREGCLSFPNLFERVKRHERVTVTFQDIEMNEHTLGVKGKFAVAVQHECEHLDGKTWLNSMSQLKRNRILDKMRRRK